MFKIPTVQQCLSWRRSGLLLSFLAWATVIPPAFAKPPFQWRCGWLSNPTPGNIWLQDRDGEWLIGAQGGYQTPGDWPWPDFKTSEWIETNVGNYGYGCACLKMQANPKTRRALAINQAYSKPLRACRQEPRLKEPVP